MNRLAFLFLFACASAAAAGEVPRERISINEHWRFTKGDPTNSNFKELLYDVRPAARGDDQIERPAEATADAAKLVAATNRVLKLWILPTGNRFVKDPAKRFARPGDNPGDDVAYGQTNFDDSGWRLVNLPHDWAIEGPFNAGGVGGSMGRLPSPGIGWYRKKLDLPASDAGKSIFLDVDGAMAYAAVWLNGHLVGGWPYGYASWRLDLTSYMIPGGDNQLAIRLDNPPDFSRWYPGAGLYRNVWLTKTQPVHVGQWGTFLTTPEVSRERATVHLKVTVDGAKVARELIALAHDEDPSRPATASMNFAKPNTPFAAALDVISLNYEGEGIRDTPEYDNFSGIKTQPQYGAFHEKFPGRMIVSTESAAVLSSRGVYLFPVAGGISNPTRDGKGGDSKIHQVSAYELHAADFGSSADKVFAAQDRNPFVAGEFVWTGWDYLGEPTPYYSSRSSYFGIIDLAGFKKDRFYLYQSRWRPDLPMVHILPHWTWPERVGQVTPVHVFTSGDEAELFLNGKSLGRKMKGQFEYRLRWDGVVYEPGTLKVVAFKNGNQWATDEMKTAAEPAMLKLEADRKEIFADGKDLSFITVTVTDKNGVTAPRADNRIHFEVEGPGEIIATDNGDPTSFESFQSPERKAFNGLCLLIVRGKPGQLGTIKVSGAAAGLKFGIVSIKTLSP